MLRDKEKRIRLLNKISAIVDKHCEGCHDPNLYQANGVNKNVRYCVSKCPHGIKVRELGKKLEAGSARHVYTKPSISVYLNLQKHYVMQKDIAKQLGVPTAVLLRWRKDWGLYIDK